MKITDFQVIFISHFKNKYDINVPITNLYSYTPGCYTSHLNLPTQISFKTYVQLSDERKENTFKIGRWRETEKSHCNATTQSHETRHVWVM